MPSTDADGSPIVILSEQEARKVYFILGELRQQRCLSVGETKLAEKTVRDLNLPPFGT